MSIEPYNPPPGGQQGRTYIIYDRGAGASAGPGPEDLPGGPNRVQRMWNRLPSQPTQAQLNPALPRFLRSGPLNNRGIVFNAWVVAMIVIGFDEWHNLGILPRPARLWDASLVYGVLVMLGFVDMMVPIANALAIGYTIMLIWQYYNGNITPAAATAANGPAANVQPTPSGGAQITQIATSL